MRQNLLEISIFDYVFEAITAKIYLWTTAYTNSLVNVTFGSGKKSCQSNFELTKLGVMIYYLEKISGSSGFCKNHYSH